MLMLSGFCFSKDKRELCSVRCGSEGFDAINEWSFGGPGKKWSVKVSVGSTLGFPKYHEIIDKGIS